MEKTLQNEVKEIQPEPMIETLLKALNKTNFLNRTHSNYLAKILDSLVSNKGILWKFL